MSVASTGSELVVVARVLATRPGLTVIEREGLVVWASGEAPAVGDRWQPTADDDGADVVLDARVHRIWYRRTSSTSDPLFRALFDVNAAIKLLIDPSDGRIVDANPAAVAFYGWELAELRARTIYDINTASPAEIAAELERARTLRRTYFEFRHRRRAGAEADVEVYSGPIELAGRTLLLSIVHDVTDTRRIEEQLRRAQGLEALGRLAAGIAHDVGNLLTVITASAQLARRRTDDGTGALMTEILSATRRGAELTRRLLALGSQQALAPADVAVDDLLAATIGLLRRTLPDHIEVRTQVTPGLPPVHVDRGKIELALLNLALNARDAMPDGGALVLSATAADQLPALVAPGAYVAVAVVDTGTGMDADTRARVFEPFFTTKPPGVGTGLGLPVAFGVVTQSGGTITVESQPGSGSTFTMYLPVA